MAKLNLPDIGSLANSESARQAINDNFTAIEEAIENTVSRDGDVPNYMEADLDLNGNKVLNVGDPTSDGDAVNLGSVRGLVNEFAGEIAELIIEGTARSEKFVATASQTDFVLQDSPGSTVNMHVFDDGLAMVPNEDFTLTGTDMKTLTFFVGRTVGHEILVRYSQLAPTDGLLRSDLANPSTNKGSHLVADKQSYANAVQRTQRQKNSDAVSIKDFGAVMDNVTDDLWPLYNALNSGAKHISIPSGTAYISQTVAIPAGVTLEGNGATLRFPQGQHGILMSGANARLQNIILDGTLNDDTVGNSGVVMYSDCTIENVTCQNFGWHGFQSADGGSHRNAVIGCRAYNCGHRGMNMSNGSTFNRVTNFQARACRRAGIILGYRSNFNIFEGVYIDGHGHSTAGSAGLWVHMNCDYNIFRDFQIGSQDITEQTDAPSVLLGAACQINTFDGFILTDCWERGLYIWNQNVDHPELGTLNAPIQNNRFSNFTIIGNQLPFPSAGILVNLDDGQQANNNIFDGFYIDKFRDGFRDNDVLTNGFQFRNFRFGGLIPNLEIHCGNNSNSYRTSTRRNCGPLQNSLGSLANTHVGFELQPSVAANGVAVTQCYPFPVHIFVSAMPASSNVSINGVLVNSTPINNGNGMYTVYPGQTITLHYASGTPIWKWFGGDW